MELAGAGVEVGGVVGGVDWVFWGERGEGEGAQVLEVWVGAAVGTWCEGCGGG